MGSSQWIISKPKQDKQKLGKEKELLKNEVESWRSYFQLSYSGWVPKWLTFDYRVTVPPGNKVHEGVVEVKHCSHLFSSHLVNKYQCIRAPLLKIAAMELEDFYYEDK